jgi:hypothetical protein
MNRITVDPLDPSKPPTIRDLGIKVFEVYRALHWSLGSGEAVLAEYPNLDHDELVAVEQHIAQEIRMRSHDDITGRPLMARDQLKHQHYYRGRCRHATVARWNADEQCFYNWREKFGRIYLETIKYPTDEEEPWWDIFWVVEELHNRKFEISFDLEAEFTGNREDLVEHNLEMWARVKE